MADSSFDKVFTVSGNAVQKRLKQNDMSVNKRKPRYHDGLAHMNGYDFYKRLNHQWQENNPAKLRMFKVSGKAVKQPLMNADRADRKFLTGRAGSPEYKRRNGRRKGVYLSRNNKAGLGGRKYRAKLPTPDRGRFKGQRK